MAEIRQKGVAQEEPVRVVERNEREGRPDAIGVQELERRVSSLQSDVAQLAQLAVAAGSAVGPSLAGPGLRLVSPAYFGAIGPFGSIVPGAVPPPLPPSAAAPLFGYGAPAYAPPEAVTMRDFSATPPVTRQPGVNIVDAGEEYVVQVELPATKKKDLDILGSDRSVTISAQVRPDPDAEGTVLLGEVAPTLYRRTILLPAPCNTVRSKAALRDGVLTLNIPKRDPSNGMRRIDVAYG